MKIKKRKVSGKGRVPVVPVDKFKFCWHLAGAVADGRAFHSFEKEVVQIGDDKLELTNHPFNTAMQAIRTHCSNQQEYQAIGQRIFALGKLLPEIEKTLLMREVDGVKQMHDSVVERAATFSCIEGKFDAEKFLEGAPLREKAS